MKKIFIFFIIFIMFIVIGCGNNNDDNKEENDKEQIIILLNGKSKNKIEVGSSYIEEGVSMPRGYRFEISGSIDSNVVGEYDLDYLVYDSSDTLVKTLSRKVYVIDTTGPVVVGQETNEYHTNYEYQLSDFVLDYYDLGTIKGKITVNPLSSFKFNKSGDYEIKIEFIDECNNKTTFTKNIVVVDETSAYTDVNDFIDEMDNLGKVIWSQTDVIINVDENTRLRYYFKEAYLEIKIRVETKLGDYADVSIMPSVGATISYTQCVMNYVIYNKAEQKYTWSNCNPMDLTKNYEDFSSINVNVTMNDLKLDQEKVTLEYKEKCFEGYVLYRKYLDYNWSELTVK